MGELTEQIKSAGILRVLIITDHGLVSLGLPNGLMAALSEANIRFEIYDSTCPNPTIENVEAALSIYKSTGCGGIIAFGGGSPMDCAKAVGARIARPRKSIQQMRGLLKVLKKLPFLAAIPTTAGTGSETTVAAVVANIETHEKFAMSDPSLIPHYTLLDPALTVGLSPAITAQTGIDALVHAVEAYIGQSNTKQTRIDAKRAVALIFANLREAHQHGANLEARRSMQEAAFLAGAAFTRAYVGNIHAIAHSLGGRYGTPHGLANAVIMPYVLEDYGQAIERSMSKLSIAAGIGIENHSAAQNAADFLTAIKKLNDDLGIPEKIDALKEADIPILVKHALKEANPLYPVPRIYGCEDMEKIFRKLSLAESQNSMSQ